MKIELAFTPEICKLCHTELKDNFEEHAAMLQISEIVKKTEEMFDLFNAPTMARLPARPSPYPRTAGAAHTAGAVSKKSGTQTARSTGKSTFAPSTLTGPSLSWLPHSYMKWLTAITIKPTATQRNKENAPATRMKRLALNCSVWRTSGENTF